MRPIKTQSSYDNNFEAGGKRRKREKIKGVSKTRQDNIRDRQIAPIERMLRQMGENKKFKEQVAAGASEGDVYSFNDGEQDMVTGDCGEGGCAAFDEEGGEAEFIPKEPLSLRLADKIAGFRDSRQDWMKNKKATANKHRDFGFTNPNTRQTTYIGKNPFARARYKSLQRRIARSEGRGTAGGGGTQYIRASF